MCYCESNMNPLISIIVPVYNAESTLNRCIDSIINQSFDDWELLLIDDGSKDQSGKICDEYATKDSRIKVFHEENGGVSSARNLGLDNACGTWITFIDSDDWVSFDYLSTFHIDRECDLIMSYYTAEGWKEWISEPYKDFIYRRKEMGDFLSDCLMKTIFPFGKMFKYSIIEDNKLRFDVNICYGEDTLFVYQYLQYVSSVKTISKATYYYNCLGGEGLSRRNQSWIIYWNTLIKLFDAIDNLAYLFKWNGKYVCDNTLILFFNRYIYNVSSTNSLGYIKHELQQLMKNPVLFKVIKENKYRTWKGKIIDWLLTHNFYLLAACIFYLKNRIIKKYL